jgi:hypothetical protein
MTRVRVRVAGSRLVRATHMVFVGEAYREIGTRKSLVLGESLYEQKCAIEEDILGYALFDDERLMGVVPFDNGPRPVSRGDTIAVTIRTYGVKGDMITVPPTPEEESISSRVLHIRWSPDRNVFALELRDSYNEHGSVYIISDGKSGLKDDVELDELGYSVRYGHRIQVPDPEPQFEAGDIVIAPDNPDRQWIRHGSGRWKSPRLGGVYSDVEIENKIRVGEYALKGNLRDFR